MKNLIINGIDLNDVIERFEEIKQQKEKEINFARELENKATHELEGAEKECETTLLNALKSLKSNVISVLEKLLCEGHLKAVSLDTYKRRNSYEFYEEVCEEDVKQFIEALRTSEDDYNTAILFSQLLLSLDLEDDSIGQFEKIADLLLFM